MHVYCMITDVLAADDDQCDSVEDMPTFVVSNDDIHNLGELLIDGWLDAWIDRWMDGWMDR